MTTNNKNKSKTKIITIKIGTNVLKKKKKSVDLRMKILYIKIWMSSISTQTVRISQFLTKSNLNKSITF